MERLYSGTQSPHKRHPSRFRSSGIERSLHPPSIPACPTCSSYPTCGSATYPLGTSSHHRGSGAVLLGGRRCPERAGNRRSGIARGWHPRCIPACPCDREAPSSRASPVRSRRSRSSKGIRPPNSCLHHKICSPRACHLPSSRAFPSCSLGPRRT